jgi:hypothetical protein
MPWFSAGVQTNPSTDAILADTGALSASGRLGEIKVVLGGNIAAVCTIEHRNAANNANLNSQVIACLANGNYDISLPGLSWGASERFRVRLNVGVVGSVQASIFTYEGAL